MNHHTIAFIGAGNMTTSLIGGLITDHYPANKIWVTNPSTEKLTALQQRFAIHITTDNRTAATAAEVLILAVKPHHLKAVVIELADIIKEKKLLVISLAAMLTTSHLQQWLGQAAIIRCMPNTPAMLNAGATGLFANKQTTSEQKNLAESIMRAVGTTVWVEDENLMEAVTVLSGCGPAYFFLIMEILQQLGEKYGLSQADARLLTLQTALGAARMALEADVDLPTLRRQVTSPGGTTEAVIAELEKEGLATLFANALAAGKQRCHTIAEKFKEEEA